MPVGDFDERPSGDYVVLEEATDYEVKRITVLVGKRLSYRRHTRREEHRLIVGGEGRVTLEGNEFDVLPGTTVDVPGEQPIASPISERQSL